MGRKKKSVAEVMRKSKPTKKRSGKFNPLDGLPKPGNFAADADAIADGMVKPKRKPKAKKPR